MKKIVITGGAGFVGSNVVAKLAAENKYDLVVCDRFGSSDKWRNIRNHQLWEVISPEFLITWLKDHLDDVEAIVHMGGISSTAEKDIDLILRENLSFSMALWKWCNNNKKRFIYASSSTTYGDGANGFDDDTSLDYLKKLHPLSGAGWSKSLLDIHIATSVARGDVSAPQWVGLKLFNSYGPNEYHKDTQKSVICQMFPHAEVGAAVRLFKSYNDKYADGGQMRDMVYVKDIADVVAWTLENPSVSGLFNLGSGKARSFNDMAAAVFGALGKETNINYISMDEELKPNYQYFTEAKMDRLRTAGYTKDFTSLEDGVTDYVQNYLVKDDPHL